METIENITCILDTNCSSGLFSLYNRKNEVQIISELLLKVPLVNKTIVGTEAYIPFAKTNQNIFNIDTSTLENPIGYICGVYLTPLTIISTQGQQSAGLSCYAYFDGQYTIFFTHLANSYFDVYELRSISFTATVLKGLL